MYKKIEMDNLYKNVSFEVSKLVTKSYSTSFSLGVRCLHPSIRDAIFAIYGFVRLADEIVDSFHQYNKKKLLDDFEADYYKALKEGISLNPVLNSFQYIVSTYNIDDDLVQAFLKSMRKDLTPETFDNKQLEEYIYGSAEVVGLMCLKVFVYGNNELYEELKPYARSLGAAFQKVNFLRDIRDDIEKLNRSYFPILNQNKLTEDIKTAIINDINADYEQALIGINKLPEASRLGVYIAYLYYKKLTDKILKTNAEKLMKKRIRVSNITKIWLLCRAYINNKWHG